MTDSNRINAFVSYSHHDAVMVAPVVKLLRVFDPSIFLDSEQIRLGKKWRIELSDAIDQAGLMLIFWCWHSSRSEEVEKEWQAAVSQNKDVLPLLLDDTPLPEALREFQWLDLAEALQHQKEERPLVPTRQLPPRVPPLSRMPPPRVPPLSRMPPPRMSPRPRVPPLSRMPSPSNRALGIFIRLFRWLKDLPNALRHKRRSKGAEQGPRAEILVGARYGEAFEESLESQEAKESRLQQVAEDIAREIVRRAEAKS